MGQSNPTYALWSLWYLSLSEEESWPKRQDLSNAEIDALLAAESGSSASVLKKVQVNAQAPKALVQKMPI